MSKCSDARTWWGRNLEVFKCVLNKWLFSSGDLLLSALLFNIQSCLLSSSFWNIIPLSQRRKLLESCPLQVSVGYWSNQWCYTSCHWTSSLIFWTAATRYHIPDNTNSKKKMAWNQSITFNGVFSHFYACFH